MLQLSPPIPVETPLGPGWAYVLLDYGPDFNPVFLVALQADGQFKNFNSNQVKIAPNYTFDTHTT